MLVVTFVLLLQGIDSNVANFDEDFELSSLVFLLNLFYRKKAVPQ